MDKRRGVPFHEDGSCQGTWFENAFPVRPPLYSFHKTQESPIADMEELSAIGEQVFDAECILNKRLRKVRCCETIF